MGGGGEWRLWRGRVETDTDGMSEIPQGVGAATARHGKQQPRSRPRGPQAERDFQALRAPGRRLESRHGTPPTQAPLQAKKLVRAGSRARGGPGGEQAD